MSEIEVSTNPGAGDPPLPSSAESAGGVATYPAASDPRALAHPILFSGQMVIALLSGRKTQTRRVIKPRGKRRAEISLFNGKWTDDYVLDPGNSEWRESDLAYRVSDHLWVREAFSYDRLDVDHDGFLPPWYWADGNPEDGDWTKPKPSIHMPRKYSRLTLTVTDVRVQRLQEISEEDAEAEGVVNWGRQDGEPWDHWRITDTHPPIYEAEASTCFSLLWERINGDGSWDANPWVAAYTFTVEKKNIDG